MAYSVNFMGYIFPDMINDQIERIANWLEENPDTDPNSYQMVNVFLFASYYSSKGYNIDRKQVKRLWELRKDSFTKCNLGKDSIAYKICEKSYESAISGKPLVDDEASHSALRSMSGVVLYISQQKRDNQLRNENKQPLYNNKTELRVLMENAKILKRKHPVLYRNYGFKNALEVIVELQNRNKGQEINADIRKEINIGEDLGIE